jgi:hypothetical protein
VDQLQQQILVKWEDMASFIDPMEFITHQQKWEQTNIMLVIHEKELLNEKMNVET